MAFWTRKTAAEKLEELSKHLRLVDHVEMLQKAQSEIGVAIAALEKRVSSLEADLRAARAETKLEAVKETQQVLNSVQGAFHEKLGQLSERVSQLARQAPQQSHFLNLPRASTTQDGGSADQ